MQIKKKFQKQVVSVLLPCLLSSSILACPVLADAEESLAKQEESVSQNSVLSNAESTDDTESADSSPEETDSTASSVPETPESEASPEETGREASSVSENGALSFTESINTETESGAESTESESDTESISPESTESATESMSPESETSRAESIAPEPSKKAEQASESTSSGSKEASKEAGSRQTDESESTAEIVPETSGNTASTPDPETELYYLLEGFTEVDRVYARAIAPLQIREGKGVNHRIVGTAETGCILYILADEDDPWIFVESGNVRGFVFEDDIEKGESLQEEMKNTVVTADNPLPEAEETVDPSLNTAFDYEKVTTKNLESLKPEGSADRNAIVSYARSFTGNRYVWGGDDPHTGADCSGFVRYVYAHFGISLPRTAHEQAYAGTKIAVSDAKPGDLIFYQNSSGYIHHVVMYAGNGKTIEAKGTNYGIGSWPLNTEDACWAVRVLDDTSASNGTVFTEEQMELIWAIVGQEDDTSYEGALAVITSAANRADRNYGGYGQNVLSQLTAPGQYCYSPLVSDPSYYQRRLNGNVPEFVKQAVHDCLVEGKRNHNFTSFRSTNASGDRTKIGSNWYF